MEYPNTKTKSERMKDHISWRKKFNGRALTPLEYTNIYNKI